MFRVMDGGWSTPSIISDPVLWFPRAENKLADRLANYTMDIGRSWKKDWPIPDGVGHNLLLQSDGGYRANKTAAAAWAIVAIQGNAVHLVSARGIHLPDTRSAFAAEAIALDDGFEHLCMIARSLPY